ncbi:DUF6932 family protein [Flavobacterium sp. FlaQc-47]|uniref:DUF6932 family protein n=1 Tax=Flavobacterium sp. FlaQc-47 TaxID=3374180 RepID=UPI0037580604
MAITFQKNGNLLPGIHIMTIEEFEINYGYNDYRKKLIEGLKIGISHLKDCGCKKIFIDGSFVTTKEIPGDFDACWDANNVDIPKLKYKYPTIVDFTNGRKNQKDLYHGEFFPAQEPATPYMLYINFFQKDKNDDPKGIVQINLN